MNRMSKEETAPSGVPVASAVNAGLLRGKSLIAFLTLLAALGTLSTNMYLASFPSIGHDLNASPQQVRLTLTVFLVGFAFGQLIIGPLSDRYGRRPLLIIGLSVFAAASLLCAVANNLEWMIAVRVIQAIGACTGSVLARAVARDLFQGDELTRALGYVTTFMAAAPGFSPLIGGLIETFYGWRMTFVVLVAVGIGAALIVWARIAETNHNRSTRLSLGHAFKSYFSLIRHRNFVMPATATTCAMGGLFAFFAASPSIFIREFGVPPALFGFIPFCTVFAVFAGGISAQRFAKRWPGMKPIVAGLMLMLIGSSVMFLLSLLGKFSIVQVLAPLVVFLYGMGVVNPLSTVAALRPFPEQAGAASALVGFFQMAGGALGTIALNALPFGILSALPLVMMLCAIIGFVAVLLALRRA
jgi:DHA1 family bicyclomycin/chloramphenicol resistance-like MFS transporter